MKKLILLGVMILVAGIVFWSYNSREPDVVKINRLKQSDSTPLIDMAKKVCEAGKNGDANELRQLMIAIDGMGFRDCTKILAALPTPDFTRAEVNSPLNDSNLFYVFVPVPGKKSKFQFTIRRQNDQLLLAGVNWSLR